MVVSSSAARIVSPIRVSPAYSDREAVWRTVVSHGPYPLMAGSEGYIELIGSHPLTPFFRSVLARRRSRGSMTTPTGSSITSRSWRRRGTCSAPPLYGPPT